MHAIDDGYGGRIGSDRIGDRPRPGRNGGAGILQRAGLAAVERTVMGTGGKAQGEDGCDAAHDCPPFFGSQT